MTQPTSQHPNESHLSPFCGSSIAVGEYASTLFDSSTYGRNGGVITISPVASAGAVLPDRRRKDALAAQMYAAYQGGLSLSQVGNCFGITRQSVFGMFADRGWPMRTVQLLPFVMYRGEKYTPDGHGYFRLTTARRNVVMLHRKMWADAFGTIPFNHDIHHKDENKAHNELSNFECLEKAEHTRLHNPLQLIVEKYCMACGLQLVRREYSNRVECPTALSKRNFCNRTCSRSWLRGKPKGTRA